MVNHPLNVVNLLSLDKISHSLNVAHHFLGKVSHILVGVVSHLLGMLSRL